MKEIAHEKFGIVAAATIGSGLFSHYLTSFNNQDGCIVAWLFCRAYCHCFLGAHSLFEDARGGG